MVNASPNSSLAMLRLCQLVSPALPVGAYNFSQALEYAVHRQWVRDAPSAYEWIHGIAEHAIGTLDLPLLARMHDAWQCDDVSIAQSLSAQLVAARETDELRAEERHLGRALAKVLTSLDMQTAAQWVRHHDANYACLFALAATRWQIAREHTLQAYLWAWCENQVLAAVKLLPLGQSAGQRVLNDLLQHIPGIAQTALLLGDEEIGIATPLHGMASAWHETQYTRLFRS